MKAYTIYFYENGVYEDVKQEDVLGSSKENAYENFMNKHNWSVYAAWVHSVTYQNGNYRVFNTFCGNPY